MVGVLSIYLVLFIAFCGNALEGYQIAPPLINWCTEPAIYFLLTYSLITNKGRFQVPFLPIILILVLITTSSALVNHQFNIKFIFSLRLVFRFIVFFIALVNLPLDDDQVKNLNSFLVVIVLLQLPVAAIKFILYGQGEDAIGTYSMSAGAVSVQLPLIAIGYLYAFYLYYKRSILYILLVISFVGFAIIAGKRGLVFILPIVLTFMVFSSFFKNKGFRDERKNLQKIAAVLAMFIIITGCILNLKLVRGLNPEQSIGGSLDLKYALEHALNYTTHSSPNDPRYTRGRLATTKQVFSVLKDEGMARFLFGYGPGSYTDSRFTSTRKSDSAALKELYIEYGVTPLSYLAIEYGTLGVICHFWLILSIFFLCLKYWVVEDDFYWKSFAFGSYAFAFSMIILWLNYSDNAVTGDTIPCLYFYCMSIVFVKWKQKCKSLSANSLIAAST